MSTEQADALARAVARVTELEAARDEYRGNAILHIRERDEARAKLAKIRETAESWATRAPAGRTVAEDFTTSPRDAVSSDCGRAILALLGERAGISPLDGAERALDGTGTPDAG